MPAPHLHARPCWVVAVFGFEEGDGERRDVAIDPVSQLTVAPWSARFISRVTDNWGFHRIKVGKGLRENSI